MMQSRKILIADDVNHVHEQLTPAFSSHGFTLLHAFDGDEAVALINDHKPDLVVLDIMMPGKDGSDICRALKNDPATRNILVLLLVVDNRPHNKHLRYSRVGSGHTKCLNL